MVVATATGFLAGASALRVRGVTLAVVTLAAAIAIEQFGFANPTWGVLYYGNAIPEPRILGIDVGSASGLRAIGGGLVSPALGLMLLASTTAVGLLVVRVRQSGLGNRMLAVRSNEAAAAAVGVSVRDTKFAAYALSSCIAAVGGVAYAYASTKVTLDSFGILVALQFVAFAYIGGITMIPGAVFAGTHDDGRRRPALPARAARAVADVDPPRRRGRPHPVPAAVPGRHRRLVAAPATLDRTAAAQQALSGSFSPLEPDRQPCAHGDRTQ